MLQRLRAQLGIQGLPHPPLRTYPSVQPRLKAEWPQLIAELLPRSILEMGSWEGRSAIAWLTICKELAINTELVCVDTWLGSTEHWLDDFPDGEWARERLLLENNAPQVFDTFCHTLITHGFSEDVVALRMTNRIATDVLRRLNCSFDLIYVDGAHDLRSVVSDLLDALTLIEPEGVIVGDDWGWPSVSRAAILVSLAKRTHLYVSKSNTSFALSRSRNQVLRNSSDWKLLSRAHAARSLARRW